MKFGKLIKKIRTKHNIKLNYVAKHLGVSVAFLCDIENGRRKPLSPKMIFAFSSLFKDHDYLVEIEKAFCKEAGQVVIKIPKNKRDRERLFDLIYSLK